MWVHKSEVFSSILAITIGACVSGIKAEHVSESDFTVNANRYESNNTTSEETVAAVTDDEEAPFAILHQNVRCSSHWDCEGTWCNKKLQSDEYGFCAYSKEKAEDLYQTTLEDCKKAGIDCGNGTHVVCRQSILKLNHFACRCTTTQFAFDQEQKLCRECNCGTKEFGCSFKNGMKKCSCRSNYADDGTGTCKACNCGTKGYGCFFENGIKTCHCSGNYADDRTGTCKACNCGTKEIGCYFENGIKTCYCGQKYADDGAGTCKACNCGTKESGCSFKNGNKTCYCETNYADDGRGACKECNCGPNTTNCHFNHGTKSCFCNGNYTDDGTGTCKECNCGPHSLGAYGGCTLSDGKKSCLCEMHYAQGPDGICIEESIRLTLLSESPFMVVYIVVGVASSVVFLGLLILLIKKLRK